MNIRIENLKTYIMGKKHHSCRHTPEQAGIATMNESFAASRMELPISTRSRLPKS